MSVFTCDAVPELRETLGEGEEGVVYGYKTYAIKVVKRRPDEEVLRMASDAGVSPKYHGTQACDGMFYVVHDRLPDPFQSSYASQIPELIVKTLEAGVHHNDYRTNNMMAADGRLKFIDFGLSVPVRSRGSRYFDAQTKNVTYQDDATRKEVPVVFTPEQMARIRAVRPTVEKTEYEKQKEAEIEQIKAEGRKRLTGYGRYKSANRRRATRRRRSRRRSSYYRGTP